jgi:hypothetical protein
MYVFGVPLYLASVGESEWDHLAEGAVANRPSGSGPNFNTEGSSSSLHLGFFTGNFTKNEVQLSQTLVHLWANFVKTG